jgi:diguanylate cyclase (GGDEF)-like protein
LLIERLLTGWGYEVISASDGDEAWWILQNDDAPKLAILDWMMPGMDGPQICSELRKRKGMPYVYVLLVTARAQKEDIIEGLEAGADDYLTKPFDANELRVRLRAGRRILDLQDHLLSASEAVRFPATLDFVTGLWNREAILGILRQLARDRRDGAPISVILASIDRYRYIVNTYGTNAGDAVVRETARRLRSAVRIYDSIGRYGARDFLIVVPGCGAADVVAAAEKLREKVAFEAVDIIGGAIPVTLSLGVAICDDPAKPVDVEQLLRAAEAAVERAKKAGRNRVEMLADPDQPERDVASVSGASGG